MADDNVIHVRMRKMRRRNKILLIIISLLLMGFLRTGFIFFVIGMMPSVVAYYMDVTKNHYVFKTIFASNLSGMMPFAVKLIQHGPSSANIQNTMNDMFTWVTIYGAALMGLLLIRICPFFTRAMVISMHQGQIMRYKWVQKRIENEWGEEVSKLSNEYAEKHGA